jgi:hypothetical protein
MNQLVVWKSLLRTLALFSFAGWFYIAENAVYHPVTLAMPLTHLLGWPREDTFGIICFGISIVSFFSYNMIKDRH